MTTSSYQQTPALIQWRKWTDVPLLIMAICSLPFLLVEIVRDDLRPSDQRILSVINYTVLGAFVVDLLAELSLTKNRKAYLRNEKTSLVVVFAQGIALLPGLGAFAALRALRATAVAARIWSIVRESRRIRTEALRQYAFRGAALVALLTWLTSACAMLLAEGVDENSAVNDIGDALWWSAATITTVGYGDVVVTSGAGRAIGGFTMVVGISVFSTVTARIASAFNTRSDEPA